MYAEGKKIVVLLDNASSHSLKTEGAVTEDLFGFRTVALGNWLNDAWMDIPPRAIQRCWWRTGCLPLVWALSLPHVVVTPQNNAPTVVDGPDGTETGLDEEANDLGLLIDRLGLGPSALSAEAFVGIDDNQPTCAKPGEDPLAREPLRRDTAVMWEAPAHMQQVYDDNNPAPREARRTARAACEMLIGYARATCITSRDLCALFDIRNPIIMARMERASPALDLNNPPPRDARGHPPAGDPSSPRQGAPCVDARSHPGLGGSDSPPPGAH
ncbi:unnamed protein product [Closterium sp. Yama58-4]|nr:unnamed protein product [Closterium sp. Yama58-4]